MIYPCTPVAVERKSGIIQRRYEVTAYIADIAGIFVHSFKDVLDVTAVQLQESAFHDLMRNVLAVYPDKRLG